jgi:predicted transposase YbfD/YdcC
LDNIEDSVYNPTVYETFVAVKPEYAFLEKDVEFNMVQLSVVTTPSNIYAQKLSSFSILEDLNKKKNSFINCSYNKIKQELLSLCYCLAKLSNESYYCRAQIVQVTENDYVQVFFVDYGDRDKVLINEIYPIEDRFITKLPFQAIKCSLEGITPLKCLSKSVEDWEYDVGDFIWKVTHDSENFHHKILVHVREEEEKNENFKHRSYVVDLYRYNLPIPIDVTHSIVAGGLAGFSETKEAGLFPYLQSNRNNCGNSIVSNVNSSASGYLENRILYFL